MPRGKKKIEENMNDVENVGGEITVKGEDFIKALRGKDDVEIELWNLSLGNAAIHTGRTTKIVAPGESVLVTERRFDTMKTEGMIQDGILVQLDENGKKVITDNPNIILNDEIKKLLRKSANAVDKYLGTVTSYDTLHRFYVMMNDMPNCSRAVAAAVEKIFTERTDPPEGPPMDSREHGRITSRG